MKIIFIKITFKSLFLVMLLGTTACAYKPKIVMQCLPQPKQCIIANETLRFSPKEKLAYVASLGSIPSANLVLEIKGIEYVNGHDCYHIVADAGPNSFFSLFFNLKYHIETYIDKNTGLTAKFYKKKTSRRKTTEETIIFDRDKNTAKCEYNDMRKKELAINQDTHDLLSFLYYYRMKGIETGKTYNFGMLYGGKIWPVEMKVGNVYLMKLKDGSCINVFAVKLSSEIISSIMGAPVLDAYVSVDSKRIPIFFTAKTRMGDVGTVLTNLEVLKEGGE
ncbi:MAG: DUF3108 domain-containing protein [Candidatus Omnitrophica bacterium]|nr:DUF3108 domain-containing protein [Candidatus Omnitrophota bacterium]